VHVVSEIVHLYCLFCLIFKGRCPKTLLLKGFIFLPEVGTVIATKVVKIGTAFRVLVILISRSGIAGIFPQDNNVVTTVGFMRARRGGMQITEVKVLPVNGDERLKAFVSIKLDACFVVRDMKIIQGNNGLFVAMPAKKMKDGTYRDLIHPLDQQTREMVEGLVLDEYKKVTSENVKKFSVVEGTQSKHSATV